MGKGIHAAPMAREFPRVSLITKDYTSAGNKFIIADPQQFAGDLEVLLQEVLEVCIEGLKDQLATQYRTLLL